MSLLDVNGEMMFPGQTVFEGQPTFSTETLDASGEKIAMVIQVPPKTGTITKVGIQYGACSNAQDVEVGLYAVSATTGDPEATNFGGSADGTDTPAAYAWHWVALDTGATVTSNDLRDFIAVVVRWTSTVGNIVLRRAVANHLLHNCHYCDFYNGSVWTKYDAVPNVALQYSDGVVYAGTAAFKSLDTVTFNQGSTPYDEYAMRFKLGFGARCCGVAIPLDYSNSGVNIRIYEGTEQIAGRTADKDLQPGTGWKRVLIYWTEPVTLTANTVYHLGVESVGETDISARTLTRPDDSGSYSGWDAVEGGDELYLAKRVDDGGWTDDTTQRLVCNLIFDQLDAGAAAEPGLLKPPLLGGALEL